MKILATSLLSLLFVTLLTACSPKTVASVPGKPTPPPTAATPGPESSVVGVYHYIGFDDKGVKIIEGRITIDSVEPRKINQETQMTIIGTWDLEEVVHRDRIGQQVGLGKLDGSVKGDEVFIDLNPNMNDANVYLQGRLNGIRIAGTWSYNGVGGPVSHGSFEAVKQ